MQAENLDVVGSVFPGMVRDVLPPHEDEVRDVPRLRATAAEPPGRPAPSPARGGGGVSSTGGAGGRDG
jgi:hypothetical protein